MNVICCILSLLFILFPFYRIALTILENGANYSGYSIPELMINFQGGFVRRGILGDLLYQVFLVHPYSFHTVIIWLETVIFVIFAIITCRIFYKLNFIPLMPFAILVDGLVSYRRDFLMILIALIVFCLVIRYVKRHHVRHLISMIATIIIAILIYEPSFFFIVPITMYIYYKNNIAECKSKRLLNTIFVFLLPIITMIIVCSAKGNSAQANAIWQSWAPLFDYLKIDQPAMPAAIHFLSKSESVAKVAMFHLGLNYGIGDGCKLGFNHLLVSGSLLFFAGMYFLTVTIPRRASSLKLTKLLSSVYLYQFLCLLPMFSILSCDFGRTILYVIFTSYYLVYLINSNGIDIEMHYIDVVSEKVVLVLSRISKSKTFVFHLIVLIFVPFNMYCGIKISHSFFIVEYWPIIQPKLASLIHLFCL